MPANQRSAARPTAVADTDACPDGTLCGLDRAVAGLSEAGLTEASYSVPGSVVLLSAEDDVSDTIRPRLIGAGADLARIVALQAVGFDDPAGGATREHAFSLASDLDVLEQVIRSLDNCRLVVIDPITAYLGASDSHNNAEMRSLLAPLSELATRTGVAVLAINHLNKTGQGPAIYRSMGSLAFAATARSVLAALADPYDPEARVLVSLKSNLAASVDGIRYRIANTTTADANGTGIRVPVVRWDTTPVRMSADELLAASAQTAVSGPALAEAAEWLASTLRDGPRPALDLKQLAKADGIHERTLLRAKQRLGVTAARQGYGPNGLWAWQLPNR
ncbi:MAG: AAA family ATPase [Planctomycetes bacterium]|nr:AAA family ATPase [Planctomycetota bacterium]